MNLQDSQAVFLCGLIAYLITRAIYQRKARTEEKSASSHSTSLDKALIFLVIVGQIFLPLAYVFTSRLDAASFQPITYSAVLGAGLWLAGMWLFWRSHADLGKNWSVGLEVQQKHQLVQHGVYRLVRHPMYAAFLLFGLAQALLLPNAIAGPSAIVAVLLLCFARIPREEAMMCQAFGQEYKNYMQTTGSVVPALLRRRVA